MTRNEKLNKLAFEGHSSPEGYWQKWLFSSEPLNFEEWLEEYYPEALRDNE